MRRPPRRSRPFLNHENWLTVWLLADLAESNGKRPSDLRMLEQMAVMTDVVRLDFDQAVRAVKRFGDRRAEETEQVPDHSPKSDAKRRMKTVARYTSLFGALGIETADETRAVPEQVEELVTQMLTTETGWQGFGDGWGG